MKIYPDRYTVLNDVTFPPKKVKDLITYTRLG